MKPKPLEGKVALVTGSARGIGRAVAERLGASGASVVVNYLEAADRAKSVADAITASGASATVIRADVSRVNDIQSLFEQSLAHFGRLDVLVNNAGILVNQTIEEMNEATFDRIFNINVKGTFFACQQAARCLHDGGRIINLSSTVTRMMLPTYGAYAATKGAVEQITRVLARELGPRQITVNSVAPGPVDTDLFRFGKSQEQIDRLAQAAALGRLGMPEDIAGIVAFLASDDGRWITGQNIYCNGGFI